MMNRFIKSLLLLIFSVLISANYALADTAKKEILLGSVAMDIPAVMYKRLSPLTKYLESKLGLPVNLKLSPNMGAAINAVVTKQVDIAYLTPVAYLKAHKKGGAQIIAKTVTNGKASFKLMIVVKDNSPIKTVQDLIGKNFAFGDKRALLQRAAVVGSGIKLEQLGSYAFIGHYDNIASAVMHEDFDAGILKDTKAYKWQNKGLRILYETPDLPPYNVAVSKNIKGDLLQKIKDAFLSLDPKKPGDLKIIKALDKKYDGFAATSDVEYDVVRQLIKPFNH